jgi:dihydrodipicolinate synthase/N-acetylneuraminate lyase
MLNFKWEFSSDFKVYCGPDSLMVSALRSELDGAVPGSGNYAPRLVKSIFENYNNDKGIESQRLLTSLTTLAQKYGQWGANYSLVKILGKYDVEKPRPPMYPLSDDLELELRKDLKKLNFGGD